DALAVLVKILVEADDVGAGSQEENQAAAAGDVLFEGLKPRAVDVRDAIPHTRKVGKEDHGMGVERPALEVVRRYDLRPQARAHRSRERLLEIEAVRVDVAGPEVGVDNQDWDVFAEIDVSMAHVVGGQVVRHARVVHVDADLLETKLLFRAET